MVTEKPLPALHNALPKRRVKAGEHHLVEVQPPQRKLLQQLLFLPRVVGQRAQLQNFVPVVQVEQNHLIGRHRQHQQLPAGRAVDALWVGHRPIGEGSAGRRGNDLGRLPDKPVVDRQKQRGALPVLFGDKFRSGKADALAADDLGHLAALRGIEGYFVTLTIHSFLISHISPYRWSLFTLIASSNSRSQLSMISRLICG